MRLSVKGWASVQLDSPKGINIDPKTHKTAHDGDINPGPLTGPTRVKEDPANLMGQEWDGTLNRAGSYLRC